MINLRIFALAVFSFSLLPQSVFAWSESGHHLAKPATN